VVPRSIPITLLMATLLSADTLSAVAGKYVRGDDLEVSTGRSAAEA